jgi:aromatic amino acid aminotransferase I
MPLDPPRVPAKPKKSLLSWLFPSTQETSSFTIPKYVSSTDPKVIQLATSLQYQAATGPPALSLFLRQYVEKIYKPAYADWDVLLNVGATDGWNKICGLLMEQGDAVLVEEWTYPGAENAFIPMEVEMVAIKMDGQGVLPEHMDEVLGGWDEEKRGKKRPHVFYTIPTGQNPTGATMMGERKKAIYEICKKYDVIICEDEPYYCLFSGEWTPKSHKSDKSIIAERAIEAEKKEGKDGNEAFIAALPPTYLTYDTDGRVIRMDVSGFVWLWLTVRPFPRRRALDLASGGSPRRPFSSSVSPAPPRPAPRLLPGSPRRSPRRCSRRGALTGTSAG